MTRKERRERDKWFERGGMSGKEYHDYMKFMGPQFKEMENEHPELVKLARLAKRAGKGNPKFANKLWEQYYSALRCAEADYDMLMNAY